LSESGYPGLKDEQDEQDETRAFIIGFDE